MHFNIATGSESSVKIFFRRCSSQAGFHPLGRIDIRALKLPLYQHLSSCNPVQDDKDLPT